MVVQDVASALDFLHNKGVVGLWSPPQVLAALEAPTPNSLFCLPRHRPQGPKAREHSV